MRPGIVVTLFEEDEQFSIDLVLESRALFVRRAWNDFQCRPLNDLGGDEG